MFDTFFTYIPIVFGAIVICWLLNRAWTKRDLIVGIYKDSKEKYKSDCKKEIQITKINYKPIIVNLLFMGYNLKLFFTDFSNEIDVFLNFWVSFFLLLLNIPLFIYKDNGMKKQ